MSRAHRQEIHTWSIYKIVKISENSPAEAVRPPHWKQRQSQYLKATKTEVKELANEARQASADFSMKTKHTPSPLPNLQPRVMEGL